jgi:Icc-related predicted phosphoesterase
MQILAIADRPPREKIKSILDKNPVDLICTLGDLDQFSLSELVDIKNIPKIGVYGNHCSGMYFEPLGITNMHLKTFEIGGLVFGGFEGCVRYKKDPSVKMYTQEEASELLKDFPHVDVMLTHCPPYGVNDEPNELAHQGFKALREYVERKKPKYLLHGHTYPSSENLVTRFADTEIVYVYEDKLVEVQSV